MRIDWLLTTIDWLTHYDAAAVVLCKGGKVDHLLAEAERKRADGDQAGARELAVQAAALLRNSGFAQALQNYPWKMTTAGEWGALATINVKAYAAYERLAAQIKGLGGDPGASTSPLPMTVAPRIVMRTPPSIVEPGKPVEVAAVVIANQPQVMLHYRQAGQQQWQTVTMVNRFRRAWAGTIPAEAVTRQGIEYRVEVRDAAGRTAAAPAGPAGAAWSASGLDLPAAVVFQEPAPAAAGQVKDLTRRGGDRLRGGLALDAAGRMCRLPGHTDNGRQGRRGGNYPIGGVRSTCARSPVQRCGTRLPHWTGTAKQVRRQWPRCTLRHSRRCHGSRD